MADRPENSDVEMGEDTPSTSPKGKGKAPEEDIEESDEEEEEGNNDEAMDEDLEDEDDLAEIDTNNIITTGRRTRGKNVDWQKAAEAAGKDLEPDEEDDEDFVAKNDDDE